MSGVVTMKHGHSGGACRRRAGPLLLLAGAVLLAGCNAAKRDSVIVGSIPDDYRTNHPIVVSESSEHIDLPVGTSSRRMTRDQAATLAGFLDGYDRRTGGTVTVLVPAGSANELAASNVASDFTRLLRERGVPGERIAVLAYQSPSPDVAPPIRVSYPVVKASTGRCGRWPKDIMDTTENKLYANFGCSYQNNLAAQVANPNDFLGPRKMTEIDAENRDAAIIDYKDRAVSERFAKQSEVDYD
ncbi:CpaD family pilus assembly lipoprotein [Nitratireductor sp. ZSWI3]|uniref:CpaD family pilus assembly protein n=1 Tax=Nitratireductor sp. ZSWI3 TaxID=2966359 RepID=UPI0021503B33|nr:CpaD family pilus assembly lipoprotein [Nitratireductor sp. ZSWI3]MCR4268289.1 CpaD family pilus assembly lipoprotein [Nitratireductor sp. ZSWI3]